MTYRPDIDGLRAVAVLLVIGYHAAPGRVPGGFIGVDVFFVISGFLITGIIARELRSGTFSFLDFYARRCRRIAPALLVVLAATWLMGWTALLGPEFDEVGVDTAAGASFTTNFVLWQQSGYFATAAAAKPLLHLWSLAVEEQFYLVWPLLLVFAYRRTLRLGAVIATVGMVSFVINLVTVREHAVATFYLLPTRLWELMLGGMLAVWMTHRNRQAQTSTPRASTAAHAAASAALAILLAAALLIDGEQPYPGWRALVPTVATALAIAAGADAWINRQLLANRAMVAVGLFSYPLYLWHWPLLSVTRITEEGPSWFFRLGVVAAAVLLAWLTWRGVEQPVRRWLPNRASRNSSARFVLATVAALIVVAAVGWTTHRKSGFPDRYPTFERVAARVYSQPMPGEKCDAALTFGGELAWCQTAGSGHPVRVLLGDSHALQLLAGLSAETTGRWIVLAEPACPPLLDVRAYTPGYSYDCAAFNRYALKIIRDTPGVEMVILASRAFNYSSESSLVVAGVSDRVTRRDVFLQGLSEEIRAIRAAGPRVVLFGDVPELDFLPTDCVDIRPVRLVSKRLKSPCAVDRTEALRRQTDYRHVVEKLVHSEPALRVFDPIPFLCDARWCFAERDGDLLYKDGQHLSAAGSRYLARHLIEWLDS